MTLFPFEADGVYDEVAAKSRDPDVGSLTEHKSLLILTAFYAGRSRSPEGKGK